MADGRVFVRDAVSASKSLGRAGCVAGGAAGTPLQQRFVGSRDTMALFTETARCKTETGPGTREPGVRGREWERETTI